MLLTGEICNALHDITRACFHSSNKSAVMFLPVIRVVVHVPIVDCTQDADHREWRSAAHLVIRCFFIRWRDRVAKFNNCLAQRQHGVWCSMLHAKWQSLWCMELLDWRHGMCCMQ